MSENGKQGIKRSDPVARPVEGAVNRVGLRNPDPTKHYTWVSKTNDPTFSIATYRAMGYRQTQYDPDSVIPTMGDMEELKTGDRVEAFGNVLMEIDLEKKAELDAKGNGMGALGQEWADKIEATIRKGEVLDREEPMSANERAKMRGITTRRWNGDNREGWGF